MAIPYQNRKIAAIAGSIFMFSLSVMMIFLGNNVNTDHGETNVLDHGGGHGGSHEEEVIEQEMDSLGFVTNTEGEFLFLSDEFCKMVKFDCSSMMKNKLFDYVNAKELPDFVSVFSKMVSSGEEMEGIGPFRMLAGKKERLLLFNGTPELGKDKKVESVTFEVKDLTEQVEELNRPEKAEPSGEAEVELLEDSEEAEAEADFDWLEKLYPKIKDISEDEAKLLVEKISFVVNLSY